MTSEDLKYSAQVMWTIAFVKLFQSFAAKISLLSYGKHLKKIIQGWNEGE